MAVISDPTIIGYFQEANFQKGIILVMWNFELLSTFLYESCESFQN